MRTFLPNRGPFASAWRKIMPIRPVLDRIVVRRAPDEEKSEGGLYLGGAKDAKAPAYGELLAIGDGAFLPNGQKRPFPAKVGDQIAFNPQAGLKLRDNGEEVLVMSEHDVVCVIEA